MLPTTHQRTQVDASYEYLAAQVSSESYIILTMTQWYTGVLCFT